jgi:hypothetical protein
MSLLVLAGGATLAACGLSTEGDAPPSLADGGDDGAGTSQPDATGGGGHDGMTETGAGDGPVGPGDGHAQDAVAADAAAQHDAPAPPDAPAGDGWTCIPLDGGILGMLELSTCTFAGTASWNENNDGKITLTNSNNFEAGAAWYPRQMPQVSAYSLTWSFRVGPGQTAGDGIAFAVLASSTTPDSNYVGMNGSGLGLQGLSGTGYAVAIDMYNTNEIRLVTMPDYTTVATKDNADTLNDGNVHSVDVSWYAPSTLTATLHSTSGDLTVTSTNAGLTTTGPAWFGFTGATGGGSDSHNEIASITVNGLCQ